MRGKISDIDALINFDPSTGMTSLQYRIAAEIETQMREAARGKARAEDRLRRLRTLRATEERRERLCRMKRKVK